MKYSFSSWINTVLQQMKFPPDREAVRQELWDHLLDRRNDFMTQGMSEADASDAAVRVMGDPVEIGWQLNRIHRPFLGWIWAVSRVLMILALVFSVCNVIWNEDFSWHDIVPNMSWDWETDGCKYGLGQYLEEPYEETWLRTGTVEQVGVYTLTLDHGSWVKAASRQRLTLGFRMDAECFLDLDPLGFSERLCAEDDLGNQYQIRRYDTNALHVSCHPWMKNSWRAPYLHLQFDAEDGLERKWVRFYIPGTEFNMKVSAEGMVLP